MLYIAHPEFPLPSAAWSSQPDRTATPAIMPISHRTKLPLMYMTVPSMRCTVPRHIEREGRRAHAGCASRARARIDWSSTLLVSRTPYAALTSLFLHDSLPGH